jgi:hypothetical protein
MGILEIILGLLLFVILVNFVFSFVPIPNGIAGTLVAILIIILLWRLVF